MALLVALIIALIVGFIAYLLASAFPQSKAYAQVIGLIASVLSFLAQLGYIHV